MEIFGVGWQELIFVVIIALIFLSPQDMQKAGRTLGRWLNQLVRSDSWKALRRAGQEIRNLPTNLMREANVDLSEVDRDIRRTMDFRPGPPVSSSPPNRPPVKGTGNTIRPPDPDTPAPEAPASSDPETEPAQDDTE